MAGGVGIAREKAWRGGGLEGWPGWRWGVVSGRAGRRGGGGQWFGRWWLAAQGVEVEDKLQALDFVSNGWKIY